MSNVLNNFLKSATQKRAQGTSGASDEAGFVFLKTDLINPDYISLLRRYLIRGQIECEADEFIQRRSLILRMLPTKTVVDELSQLEHKYIQIEDDLMFDGPTKSDVIEKVADRFNSTEAEMALSKRLGQDSLELHFLKCLFLLKKLAKMSYYQKGVLEEAIKLQ